MREMPGYIRTLDLGSRGLLHAPALHPHFPHITTLKLSHNSIAFLPAHLSDLVVGRGLLQLGSTSSHEPRR